jgi:hypothetical protein
MDKLRDWKNKLNDIETVEDYLKFRDQLDVNQSYQLSNKSN